MILYDKVTNLLQTLVYYSEKKKQSVIQSVSEISVPAGIDQTLSKLCDLFDGEV